MLKLIGDGLLAIVSFAARPAEWFSTLAGAFEHPGVWRRMVSDLSAVRWAPIHPAHDRDLRAIAFRGL